MEKTSTWGSFFLGLQLMTLSTASSRRLKVLPTDKTPKIVPPGKVYIFTILWVGFESGKWNFSPSGALFTLSTESGEDTQLLSLSSSSSGLKMSSLSSFGMGFTKLCSFFSGSEIFLTMGQCVLDLVPKPGFCARISRIFFSFSALEVSDWSGGDLSGLITLVVGTEFVVS